MLFKNNELIMAPMAGVTDRVFRQLCKENGADIVVSEMVSAEGLLHGSHQTSDLLRFSQIEHPIGIQLFGSNPEHLARAAQIVCEFCTPDFIDLNSGCPVPKVVKRNGGASLLRHPKLFEQIVSSLVKAVSIPITVKIRSGWNKYEWVDTEFARIAQDCGAAAITLHPRSQTMGFSGHSFWERIAEVKSQVSIPVIGNGDITTPAAALKMFKETGCDAIMVGRAACGAPWIFQEIRSALQGEALRDETTLLKLKFTTAHRHLTLFRDMYSESRASAEMKKHIAWYLKGIPGTAPVRDRLFRSTSTSELAEILHVLESMLTVEQAQATVI